MARSRAGLGLTIVALFGAFALAVSDRRNTSGVTPAKLLVGAVALAVMFAVQYALYRILQRFTDDPLEDARVAFARNTFAAAKAYMPFGSGMGTFVPVYARFEKPQDALVDTFANRAHNDVLELWLEAGIAGLGLMAIFLAWLVARSMKVWRSPAHPIRDIDISLARAATIVVGLIIAHSFVDYPLRTGAMMAVLVFACVLLIEPVAGAEAEAPTAHREATAPAESLQASASFPHQPAPGAAVFAAPSPQQATERWGQDVKWPEEWSKEAKERGPESKPPGSGKPPSD
jgi:O-antigen ligase